MSTDSFFLQKEVLTEEVIIPMIASTVGVFSEYSNKEYLYNYASKLSKYANFITVRNAEEQLISLIAFYSNNPDFSYISFVCVLPEYKRKGLSQRMLCYLENYVRRQGVPLIKLEVRKNNIAAICAYQKYGFHIHEEASLDSYFMCKELEKCGGKKSSRSHQSSSNQ